MSSRFYLSSSSRKISKLPSLHLVITTAFLCTYSQSFHHLSNPNLSTHTSFPNSFIPSSKRSRFPSFSQTISNLFCSTVSSCSSSELTKKMNDIDMNHLTFDNRNLRLLPVDPDKKNYCRSTPNAIFSFVDPTPVKNPMLIAYSKSALELLGLTAQNEDQIVQYLSGNNKIPGSLTAAHCYCGHQFGSFAGQLGDGAAISLGEVLVRDPSNDTTKRWELQLKGAGLTPYSRNADGRKVLRSSVREFLCSEAMHYLNVPTTRAGSCVTSDSTVERDPFYDGHVVNERSTVVSRISENFFRFGSFEIFKPKGPASYDRAGPSAGNQELKEKLFHQLLLYFPEITEGKEVIEASSLNRLASLYFREIVKRTATLVAKWQAVGFVHGVLNTDNMSIMGVTIDYGPYGFMEQFDPNFVPNGKLQLTKLLFEVKFVCIYLFIFEILLNF
jgi:uncharacterized protein YdiU (UPF0061 family)